MDTSGDSKLTNVENKLNLNKLNIDDEKSRVQIKSDKHPPIHLRHPLKPSAAHCAKWIQESDFSSSEAYDAESIGDSETTVDSESVVDSEYSMGQIQKDLSSYQVMLQKRDQNITSLSPGSLDHPNTILDGNKMNIFKDIKVEQSDNVYLGNVTNINIYKVKPSEKKKKEQPSIEVEENVPEDIFVRAQVSQVRALSIIPRRRWLAQRAIEFEEFTALPKIVIICHTATESAKTTAENISLVRDIQSFHIEARKWTDIGYNFLIGEDGNVFEGRGWNRVGAHTFSLNRHSIGIAFVGCYMVEEVPAVAVSALSALLDYAVNEKHVAPNYQLVGHCQFQPSESPGKYLYDIIKKHPHWEPNPASPQ